jgi:hypothetical protein
LRSCGDRSDIVHGEVVGRFAQDFQVETGEICILCKRPTNFHNLQEENSKKYFWSGWSGDRRRPGQCDGLTTAAKPRTYTDFDRSMGKKSVRHACDLAASLLQIMTCNFRILAVFRHALKSYGCGFSNTLCEGPSCTALVKYFWAISDGPPTGILLY